jgi:ubiquinone/menaquinone biosynthesis C-methylase UbiE
MSQQNNWDLIWNERGEGFPVDDAMAINGFDQAFGTINASNFHFLVEDLTTKLNLNSQDDALEVGCGAGALVNAFSTKCKSIHATDLSPQMVVRAKKLYPTLNFVASDPRKLPYKDASFTKIYVHSVFQYFPDYAYAREAIEELHRVAKPDAIILLADIMDLGKKDAYLQYRNSLPSSKVIWKSSVSGPVDHLYYAQEFFSEFKNLFQVECLERNIPNYDNGKYRFDVRLKKT